MKKYQRTSNSPYHKGSAADIKLSQDAAAYSAANRAKLGRQVRGIGRAIVDVASGRALVQGAKVVYRGTIGNALKVDDRHNRIIRKRK